MKIFKKNQLAILVIALMLITAGYLNYDTMYGKTDEVSSQIDNTYQIADVGDAELVNANITTNTAADGDADTAQTNNTAGTNTASEDTTTQTQSTAAKVDDYFTSSKLERNVMYSQMIERYQGIIDSTNQAEGQKGIAEQEINKINDLQNAIMIAENLLSTKGFTQNIIFVNGESVSVIIGKEELKQEEIAQIQNIISRELSVNIENIHISIKDAI